MGSWYGSESNIEQSLWVTEKGLDNKRTTLGT